jgi:DNA gyrase/topoisomerase IV subunit B
MKSLNHRREGVVVGIKQSYLAMIRAFPGGWDAMVGALGMSRDALENRIYERKGQGVLVETALQMQKFSGTTCFAEAIATASGGTFVRLPEVEVENADLTRKFNELYAELGRFSSDFNQATADDEIDRREEALLRDDADRMHKTLSELVALTMRVYGKALRQEGE